MHALKSTLRFKNLFFLGFLCRSRELIETRDTEVPPHQLNNSSSSSEDVQSISYLHDDPMVPIYRQGLRKGLATKKVADILFHPRREHVARAVPTAIFRNSVFLVDISAPHVQHFKNVLADDLGTWNPTGTKQKYYRAATKRNPVRKASQSEYVDNGAHVYKCTRVV